MLAPGVVIACRRPRIGDEYRMTAEETQSLHGFVRSSQRQAAAARLTARQLLAGVGWADWSLPRRVGRGPSWPPGLVGSIAHCPSQAAAAVADQSSYVSVGIDIERADPLDPAGVDLFASTTELSAIGGDPIGALLLFCAKEATYKCVHPLDGRFLEPHDIVVDLRTEIARTRHGWEVALHFRLGSHIVALATLRG